MGWIKKVHKCSLPNEFTHGYNSVWQCDECGFQWVLTKWINQGCEIPIWKKIQPYPMQGNIHDHEEK